MGRICCSYNQHLTSSLFSLLFWGHSLKLLPLQMCIRELKGFWNLSFLKITLFYLVIDCFSGYSIVAWNHLWVSVLSYSVMCEGKVASLLFITYPLVSSQNSQILYIPISIATFDFPVFFLAEALTPSPFWISHHFPPLFSFCDVLFYGEKIICFQFIIFTLNFILLLAKLVYLKNSLR